MTVIDLPAELWQRIGAKLDAKSLVNLEIALPRDRQAMRQWAWGPGTSDYVPPYAIPLNDSLSWRESCIHTWPLLKAPKRRSDFFLGAALGNATGHHAFAIQEAQPLERWPVFRVIHLRVLVTALTAQGRIYEANLLSAVPLLQEHLSAAVQGGNAAAVAALLAAGARTTLGDLARACRDGQEACVNVLARDVALHDGWNAVDCATEKGLGKALLEGQSAGSALALMRHGLPAMSEAWWLSNEISPIPLMRGLLEQTCFVERQQVSRMINFSAGIAGKRYPSCGLSFADVEHWHVLARFGGLTQVAATIVAGQCVADANWPAAHASLKTLVHDGFELGPRSWSVIKACKTSRFALLPRLQDMVKLGFNVDNFHQGKAPEGCKVDPGEGDSVLHVVARSNVPDALDCLTYLLNQGAAVRRVKARGWPGEQSYRGSSEARALKKLLNPTVAARLKHLVLSRTL